MTLDSYLYQRNIFTMKLTKKGNVIKEYVCMENTFRNFSVNIHYIYKQMQILKVYTNYINFLFYELFNITLFKTCIF